MILGGSHRGRTWCWEREAEGGRDVGRESQRKNVMLGGSDTERT